MYDDIDLKHVAKINFWTGAASGFIAGLIFFFPVLGALDALGYADKLFDFFGFK